MSSLRTLAALLMTCGAVLLPAAPAHASTHQVMIHNYAYSPASLVIAQGDTVTWTNMDTAQHDVSVTRGPTTFKSPMLAQGKSWSFTFSGAGSYSYICSVHPDMKASVTVKAAAPASGPTPTAALPGAGQHPVAATEPDAPKTTAAAKPTPAATRAPTPSAQAAASGPVATTAVEPAEATLDPLLIVLGLSAAVMVFCLLLMASRPQIVEHPDEADDRV